ncbi:MAG: TetR/AcrR family transcriptional regulator [Desulfobacter sp.]|nr:TetR/AcrR family transcriptional regulator [Desulfobacter sp.]WDP87404.1 MAG: TetR/AcrR family transcriptional regulator [Desulfobacter sp.]
MPRKSQFTAEKIVETAYALARENGWDGLSVTAVAKKIGSSTMPVYSYFDNLEKLKDAVVVKAWHLLMEYETRHYTGDAWVDQSMGYIRFAMAENNLFHCMFDGRNNPLQLKMRVVHWNRLTRALRGYEAFKGLESEQMFLIRYSRGMYTHGLATSVISNWGKLLEVDGMVENLVVAMSRSILEGYKLTYDCENENIGFIDKEIKKMFKAGKLEPDHEKE